MPVPFLAPLIGSLLASSTAGAAISGAVGTALGGAAATGIGSLLASAAPAAIGAGIGTLVAGGRPEEALANAAMFGMGGAALGNLGAAGEAAAGAQTAAASTNPLQALRILNAAGVTGSSQPAPQPMAPLRVPEGRPSQPAAPMSMAALPQQQPTPSPIPMAPQQIPEQPMVAQPAMFGQEQMPAMFSPGMNMIYPQGGIASAMAQRQFMPMMRDGGYIEGPGTGRSDSIKAQIYQDGVPVQEARLSDGEFVMTERAVRGAGNGDREKGAAKMYRMMKEFERGGRV